jgi:hypothetical protein
MARAFAQSGREGTRLQAASAPQVILEWSGRRSPPGRVGTGTLPPVLDFEVAKGLRAVDALARAVAFLEAVEDAWGKAAIVYASPNFIMQLAQLAGPAGTPSLRNLANCTLWVAHYRVAKAAVPAPWTDWTIWQFAGDGGYRMPNGVVVDVNWCERATRPTRSRKPATGGQLALGLS